MGKSLRFVIERDINDLSPNRRHHWRERHRLEAAWKLTAMYGWAKAGSPWVGEKVRITFTVRRGRLLDPGNAVRSLAFTAIENGLKGRAFPDDSARHIEYGSLKQEPGVQYRHAPEVEVLIEEVTEFPHADGGRPRPLDGEAAPAHPAAADHEHPHPEPGAR